MCKTACKFDRVCLFSLLHGSSRWVLCMLQILSNTGTNCKIRVLSSHCPWPKVTKPQLQSFSSKATCAM